jgi:hypothetical protein
MNIMDKMNKLNKKAQAFYLIWHIFRTIFIIIIFLSVVLLIRMYIKAEIPTTRLQTEVFFNRLFYSPDAISYNDPYTSRSYPGIIDLGKFNSANIENAINYDYDKMVAAKLIIYDKDNNLVKESYFNQKWYTNWYPLAASSLQGKGSATRTIKTFYVTYFENNEFKEGILTVDIIVPNS